MKEREMQVDGRVADLKETLRAHVSANLSFQSEEPLDDARDLLADGLIDSMGVMELVSFIEETFEVTVDDEDITAENFRSLEQIVVYVATKQGLDVSTRYVQDLRELVRTGTAPGAVVLLLTQGDDALLKVPDRSVWHFPCEDDGQFRNGKPLNGEDAIEQVERLRVRGATHLVLPTPELWWLDYYMEFREYLDLGGGAIVRTEHGAVYALPSPTT